jgi:hypothetical protein
MLAQIQSDLLNPTAPLTNILRKALVLARQLGSNELRDWVQLELNGYQSVDSLPDYRVLTVGCCGTLSNGYQTVSNVQVLTATINNGKLRQVLEEYLAFEGIRTIEQCASTPDITLGPNATVLAVLNSSVDLKYGFRYIELKYNVTCHHFAQILDNVRNRLLGFILELGSEWKDSTKPPPYDRVDNMVSVIIYNQAQGGHMAVFDQRNQQVNYQYNAAGNINISAVQNRQELAGELEKLRAEIVRAREAKAIGEEEAIDAEYHILQATRESKSESPDKATFLDHMNKVRAVLENAIKATGLATAVIKAIELGQQLLP